MSNEIVFQAKVFGGHAPSLALVYRRSVSPTALMLCEAAVSSTQPLACVSPAARRWQQRGMRIYYTSWER